jgi:hypothetical protein
MQGCTHVSDTGLRALAKVTSLSKLVLVDCVRVTDSGVRALARLPRLTTLNLQVRTVGRRG